MDRFESIYQLYPLLSGRRTPAFNRFLQGRPECSESTIKRLASRQQIRAISKIYK